MKTKICATCHKRKKVSKFHKNKGRKDGYQQSCKSCRKTYCSNHYLGNKEAYAKRRDSWKEKQKKRIVDYLDNIKKQPCEDCEKTWKPCQMDFHHVRGKKLFSIADGQSRLYSLSRIKKELAKCILVCANCHRLRHDAG